MPQGNIRTIHKQTRYTQEEFKRLEYNFRRSTSHSLSEYIRKQALQEPVSRVFRDGSVEKVLDEMVLLRKEMERIYELGVFTMEQTERLVAINKTIGENISKIVYACENYFIEKSKADATVPRAKGRAR